MLNKVLLKRNQRVSSFSFSSTIKWSPRSHTFIHLAGPKPSTQKTDVLFQKLQKIDLETGLEPLAPPFPKFVPPDPVVCDMVKLSEARIELMDKTIDDLSSKNKDLENEIQLIRDQLGKREQEIARLGAQLEISRSQQYLSRNTVTNISKLGSSLPTFEEVESRLPTGGETMSNQRVAQLEMHVEYLQEHISELEKVRYYFV